jgi:ribonuclease T1
MRRAVLILAAVALTLAAATVWMRLGPDGGRGVSPPAPGPVAGETPGPGPTIAPPPATRPGTATRAGAAGLERARDVLAAIEARHGEPPEGHVGGRAFHNRERRLPAGRYREYDVHPRVPGRDRGPERLVIEQTTGRAYYTRDHYRTFVPLN